MYCIMFQIHGILALEPPSMVGGSAKYATPEEAWKSLLEGELSNVNSGKRNYITYLNIPGKALAVRGRDDAHTISLWVEDVERTRDSGYRDKYSRY